ncbi:MAG: hypothetical protein GXO60_08025 [Epsilonproteobacteria bacterium]|nr:hypothetical protein [Campylobacterota bacterium]
MKQLVIFILFTKIIFAFHFDNWESSMTLNQIIQIAKKNNIPLQKNGIITSCKVFKKSLLYLDKYPNNRIFKYNTELLNQKATIYLYFTKISKKLYKIKINWTKHNKQFEENLYKILDKKYGKRKILTSSIGELIFFKQREWRKDNKTVIRTKISNAGTILFYIDKDEEKRDNIEKKKIINKNIKQSLIKDSNKF